MKKLSRTDAQTQARRLQACPALAPQSDDGRKEIVDALLRHCEDLAHASRTMTTVLDDCSDPRNLVAAIKSSAIATLHSAEIVPEGCAQCRLDPDPMTGEKRWMNHIPGERNGYSCAVRCGCNRGQWLARRDREREGQQVKESRHGAARPDYARIAAGDWER